jgi:hypothetical protein
MNYMTFLPKSITKRRWVSKATGEEQSGTFLEGETVQDVSFKLDKPETVDMYEKLIGVSLLVPYVQRGEYQNLSENTPPIRHTPAPVRAKLSA